MEKDPKLSEPVLRALLKFWPLTNSQKEVLFIGELEEVLELTQVHLHQLSFPDSPPDAPLRCCNAVKPCSARFRVSLKPGSMY